MRMDSGLDPQKKCCNSKPSVLHFWLCCGQTLRKLAQSFASLLHERFIPECIRSGLWMHSARGLGGICMRAEHIKNDLRHACFTFPCNSATISQTCSYIWFITIPYHQFGHTVYGFPLVIGFCRISEDSTAFSFDFHVIPWDLSQLAPDVNPGMHKWVGGHFTCRIFWSNSSNWFDLADFWYGARGVWGGFHKSVTECSLSMTLWVRIVMGMIRMPAICGVPHSGWRSVYALRTCKMNEQISFNTVCHPNEHNCVSWANGVMLICGSITTMSTRVGRPHVACWRVIFAIVATHRVNTCVVFVVNLTPPPETNPVQFTLNAHVFWHAHVSVLLVMTHVQKTPINIKGNRWMEPT